MYLHAHRNLKKKKKGLSSLKEANLIWEVFCAKIIRDISDIKTQRRRGILMLKWLGENLQER